MLIHYLLSFPTFATAASHQQNFLHKHPHWPESWHTQQVDQAYEI
jgi:hypothetical protein